MEECSILSTLHVIHFIFNNSQLMSQILLSSTHRESKLPTNRFILSSLPATAKELCAVNHQNSDNDEASLPRLFHLCRYGYCPCFCKRCNSSKSTQRRHSFVYCSEWYVTSHKYVEGVIFVTRYNDDDGD